MVEFLSINGYSDSVAFIPFYETGSEIWPAYRLEVSIRADGENRMFPLTAPNFSS